MPISAELLEDIVQALPERKFYVLPPMMAADMSEFKERIPELKMMFAARKIPVGDISTQRVPLDGEHRFMLFIDPLNVTNARESAERWLKTAAPRKRS